jgi:hypothetical protein
MINFDNQGLLKPYQIITLNLDEFITAFANIENKDRRIDLLGYFLNYAEDLKSIIKEPFFQFIDGSFTTQNEFPRDIDVVTFIPYLCSTDGRWEAIKLMGSRYLVHKVVVEKPAIDQCFSLIPDERNPDNAFFIKRYDYWVKWFSKTRKYHPKGLIKIEL